MHPSVVISTYNGAAKLPYLLDALAIQTFRDFELLVVVDGSTDETLMVLSTYRSVFPAVRIIEQVNSGRAKVRNRGAAEAKGDLLIFYDDDMVPSPDSIERHVAFHAVNEDSLLSGNPLEPLDSAKTDVMNYKACRGFVWLSKYRDSLTRLDIDNLFFTAANCSLRKSVFIKLNGFDERLTDAEDLCFARLAMELGFAVFLDKTNIAIHRDLITARSYVLRLRQYAVAHEKLNVLFPDIFRKNSGSSGVFRRVAYRILANPKWIHWIDNHSLTFLPQSFRYRLYAAIFHALSVEFPRNPL